MYSDFFVLWYKIIMCSYCGTLYAIIGTLNVIKAYTTGNLMTGGLLKIKIYIIEFQKDILIFVTHLYLMGLNPNNCYFSR